MSWMWLLCLFLGHFSGSCMQTLFFYEGRTHLFAGSELEEEIARETHIIFQPNRLMFREWSIVTLCIESFSVDVVRSLSFSSVNNSDFGRLILQVEKRGRTSSLGCFSFVACQILLEIVTKWKDHQHPRWPQVFSGTICKVSIIFIQLSSKPSF